VRGRFSGRAGAASNRPQGSAGPGPSAQV
jgi:hypothetical protein